MMDPRTKIKKIFDKKKLGILIVDDQPFNNMAVKILLQSFYLELQIIEAYNGHQAILKVYIFINIKVIIILRRIEYNIRFNGFEYANPKWMVGIFTN